MNIMKVICNESWPLPDQSLYRLMPEPDKLKCVENYSTWPQHGTDLQSCLPSSSLTLLSGSHFALKYIFLLQTLLCPALLDNRANYPFT